MLALVEQKLGGRIGNANPTIYALANNSKYYVAGQNTLTNSTVVFNDVTGGGNQMLCTATDVGCANGGTIGYNAGNGYDLATGWGSVNLTNLANDWALVTPLGIGSLGANLSATSLTASPGAVASGATVALTATVTGSAGTPTGTVQFTANNVPLGSAVAVTVQRRRNSYSWVTACSNLGQQVMNAYYSGDANYQGSVGPVLTANGASTTSNGSFVVTPVEVQVTSSTCPDFSLAPSTAPVSPFPAAAQRSPSRLEGPSPRSLSQQPLRITSPARSPSLASSPIRPPAMFRPLPSALPSVSDHLVVRGIHHGHALRHHRGPA